MMSVPVSKLTWCFGLIKALRAATAGVSVSAVLSALAVSWSQCFELL